MPIPSAPPPEGADAGAWSCGPRYAVIAPYGTEVGGTRRLPSEPCTPRAILCAQGQAASAACVLKLNHPTHNPMDKRPKHRSKHLQHAKRYVQRPGHRVLSVSHQVITTSRPATQGVLFSSAKHNRCSCTRFVRCDNVGLDRQSTSIVTRPDTFLLRGMGIPILVAW